MAPGLAKVSPSPGEMAMTIIFRLIDRLAHAMFLIGVLSGVIMTFVVFTSTLMRYLLNSPIHFSNELAGLLFFSITFLTIPHVLNINRHINIDMLVRKLPIRVNGYVAFFSGLVMVLFSLVFIYESWSFVNFSRTINARSDISGILLWPWMMLMPLCFVMCILVKIKHGFVPPESSENDISTEAL
jgi:TRAP-type C4-dicarboxylate transport system permease small subunit